MKTKQEQQKTKKFYMPRIIIYDIKETDGIGIIKACHFLMGMTFHSHKFFHSRNTKFDNEKDQVTTSQQHLRLRLLQFFFFFFGFLENSPKNKKLIINT